MRSPFFGSPFRGQSLDPNSSLSSSATSFSTATSSSTASSSVDRLSCKDQVQGHSNTFSIIGRVFSSCFLSIRSISPGGAEDLPKPHSFPPASSNSSVSSGKRLTSRGRYSSSRSAESKPGGMTFTISDIKKATKNFSLSYKIGQGAFGTVFKGILNDGTIVAIKRANKEDKNMNVTFHNEISTLEQIKHLNLVSFMGYLEYKDERIIVVEYVPNGTLREHLDCKNGKPLDFGERLEIAIDVAHAITYLHMYADNPIIHRDIKSSNILLTDNLHAKVSDFGFARLCENDFGVSHIVTEVKGTIGYLDPEYLITNQVTVKSDVYSFGMLLLELFSGRNPIEQKRPPKERQTLKWATKKFTDGNYTEILDPKIPQTAATNITLEKILKLVFECVSLSKKGRPNMKMCGEVLWSIRKEYRAHCL